MADQDIEASYRAYIACLNDRRWSDLPRHVSQTVRYNDSPMGLDAYRVMLVRSCTDIPDLRFDIAVLMVDRGMVACRLLFDCRPTSLFLGLPIHGRRISFAENVFYRFEQNRIAAVWSVIDKAAIEAQIGASG